MDMFQISVIILLAGIFFILLLIQRRKSTPSQRQHPYKIQVGVPGSHGSEFIASRIVEDPGETFQLELPGGITEIGNEHQKSIIPVGMFEIPGNENSPSRFAVLHFAEQDSQETDKALAVFKPYGKQIPIQYSILTETENTSYGEIISGAEDGRYNKDSPLMVNMRVKMLYEGQSTAIISSVIKGQVVALATTDPGGHSGHSEGKHFWDCHSHWYDTAFFNRYKLCHGPCKVGTCLTWWNRKQWEDGWQTCSC